MVGALALQGRRRAAKGRKRREARPPRFKDRLRRRAARAQAAFVTFKRQVRAAPAHFAGTGSLSSSGSPYGRSSGNGTNSRTRLQSWVKSLFTSPERQSVISPAASG